MFDERGHKIKHGKQFNEVVQISLTSTGMWIMDWTSLLLLSLVVFAGADGTHGLVGLTLGLLIFWNPLPLSAQGKTISEKIQVSNNHQRKWHQTRLGLSEAYRNHVHQCQSRCWYHNRYHHLLHFPSDVPAHSMHSFEA